MRQVALREEEVQFAELVREAEAGESVTVTLEGRPVAQIVPFAAAPAQRSEEDRLQAVRELEAFLAERHDLGIVWNGRDELYDRD